MPPQRKSVLLATAGYDHHIRLWEASNGTCYHTLQHEGSQVNRLEISPNKQWIAAAGNPHIRLYDVNGSDQKPTRVFEGHSNNVTAIGFHKDGKWLFSGSEDGSLKIWDLRAPTNSAAARDFGTPKYQREYDNRSPINTVALHPNQGELIAGDQSGHIRVFDLAENKMSYSTMVSDDAAAVRSISVATDGSMAAVASDMQCACWKLRKGANVACEFEAERNFTAHSKYVLQCLISPNMRTIATVSADCSVRTWSVASIWDQGDENEKNLPDGKLHDAVGLGMGTEERVGGGDLDPPQPEVESGIVGVAEAVHNPPTMSAARESISIQPAKELLGHRRWVWDAVFSADSAYLVTASSDGTARLWDLERSESLRSYSVPGGGSKAITAVAMNDCTPD